jgi:hypothetical protein
MIKPGVEHYVGEGLIVSHAGGKITVWAQGERVCLEPALWYQLLAWVKRAE